VFYPQLSGPRFSQSDARHGRRFVGRFGCGSDALVGKFSILTIGTGPIHKSLIKRGEIEIGYTPTATERVCAKKIGLEARKLYIRMRPEYDWVAASMGWRSPVVAIPAVRRFRVVFNRKTDLREMGPMAGLKRLAQRGHAVNGAFFGCSV